MSPLARLWRRAIAGFAGGKQDASLVGERVSGAGRSGALNRGRRSGAVRCDDERSHDAITERGPSHWQAPSSWRRLP
jgi:hypothetical protein